MESTPLFHNSTQERVIYYLHLYQDWKHPLSGVWTLYQESTVRCKASSIKIQSRRHSLTHIPFQERPYSGRRKHYLFTIIYKDLFWNLKKLPGGRRTYVSSIHLFTCIPAFLVLVYLVGVIPRRHALWAQLS